MTNEVTHLKSSGTGWELQEQIQTTSCLWKKKGENYQNMK